jgi:putative FmdB family regulatory protein
LPRYDFKCRCQKVTEETFKISECPRTIECPVCGRRAKKIITCGFSLRDNDVPWLESAKQTLPNDAKPIETRSGLNKYLKQKGLECIG